MNKMAKSLITFGIVLTTLLSCAVTSSSDDTVEAQMDLLPMPDQSALLFEESYADGGATGKCVAYGTDQWYGTYSSFTEIQAIYQVLLEDSGWIIKDDDSSLWWFMKSEVGEFSLSVHDYSGGIELWKISYTIPNEVLEEMENYPSLYRLSLIYVDQVTIDRCYE